MKVAFKVGSFPKPLSRTSTGFQKGFSSLEGPGSKLTFSSLHCYGDAPLDMIFFMLSLFLSVCVRFSLSYFLSPSLSLSLSFVRSFLTHGPRQYKEEIPTV